jgi:hypothetical protein
LEKKVYLNGDTMETLWIQFGGNLELPGNSILKLSGSAAKRLNGGCAPV